jgi:hypothetical protein
MLKGMSKGKPGPLEAITILVPQEPYTMITSLKLVSSLIVLALLGTVAVPAAQPNISFKKRGDAEKQFVTDVGKAIVKAAHKTGKKVALIEYKYTNPKPNRTELKIQMEFYGAVTGKRYVANVVIKIDSTDKKAWEVLNIDYSDNDNVPYNEKKIQALIKELNK